MSGTQKKHRVGWFTITEDAVTLRRPFRRTLSLRYEDVRYVGIGRSYAEDMSRRNGRFIYTPASNFWLYISCDPVPASHLTDMYRFRQTDRGLRIAYSSKAFAALHACLPPRLAKQLERSKTTLRAWGVKDA